jgi:general secretion pathway protein L
LPSLTESNLRRALYFEIDRQTPFRSDDVYFDYRVVARNPQAKDITVELTTVPRSIVDETLSRVREWGLQPSVVDVADSDKQLGIGVNLLKGVDGEESGFWRSPLNVASTMLFIGLLAAVFYVPMNQMATMDESLAAQVSEERDRAKHSLAVRDELEQAIRASHFLDERKKNLPGTLRMLDELTKALPDSTWLFTMSLQSSQVKISGYSAGAANLISVLGTRPLFKNPAFSSPITQDTQSKLERFDILLNVGSDGAKK